MFVFGSKVKVKISRKHVANLAHRCCRTMSRITIAHTTRHHNSSSDLFERLGILSVDTYYHRSLLQ